MNLYSETIWDLYSLKDRKVLCQIKINPNSQKFKNCRFLSQEQWMIFDTELEKLLTAKDSMNGGKRLQFNIKPHIEVKIQKSELSFKNFCKVWDAVDHCCKSDVIEHNLVLECLINFHLEVPISFTVDSQEYEPHIETSVDDALSDKTSNKVCKTDEIHSVRSSGSDFANCDEIHTMELGSNEQKHKPKLTPTKEICTSSDSDSLTDNIIESDYKTGSRLRAVHTSRGSYGSSPEDEIGSEENEYFRTKSTEMSKNMEHRIVPKTTKETLLQTSKITMHKKRSKSDDILLELNDENSKVQQESRIKQSQHDIDVAKKHSRTLDEIPVVLSTEGNEKSTKNHNSLESKNDKVHSLKEINALEDKETKLSQDEVTPNKLNETPPEDKEIKLSQDEVTSNKLNVTPPDEIDSLIDSTKETSPRNIKRGVKNPKFSRKETTAVLRRSERSPSKPKRLIDEEPDFLIKSKPKKHKSIRNKELFGTDDDEDDLFENNSGKKYNSKEKSSTYDTPVTKKYTPCTSSSSSASAKKKRKHDKSNECQQEKRGMSKWLSKKNITTKSSKSGTKSSLSKPLPLKTSLKGQPRKDDDGDPVNHPKSPITLELPSKEELQLIRSKTKLTQKENARVRAELDKMNTLPPKAVEILSLRDIPLDEILDTFLTHKSQLDEIYETNCKKDYIKGHGGINHCFVIRLLEQSIQMKMLEKLTEVYNNSDGATQATLFANALLPEWVIRVYMEKFNFTRQQAIDQVKAQEEFQLHMEEQNDNSFMFD